MKAAYLDKLPHTEARSLLERLCADFYGNGPWRQKLASDTGYATITINKWFQTEARPPTIILLLMLARVRIKELETVQTNFRKAITAVLADPRPDETASDAPRPDP